MKKNVIAYCILAVFLSLFFIYTVWFNFTHTYSADEDAANHMSYVKGKVVEVTDERLSPDSYRHDAYVGEQDVNIKILKGKHKGETVSATNYVSTTHHIFLTIGETVMVGIDDSGTNDVHYYIFQYYRLTQMYILISIFILIILIIGRKKGIMTVLALAFAVYTLVAFTIPLVYNGSSPIIIGILTVAIITTFTLVLLNGISKKTMSAIISTASGVLLSGVIYAVFSASMHVNGYNISESDAVLAISQSHGLKIYHLMFTGILIASLGAVMDVAMSITSSLNEMIAVAENVSRKRLFTAGLNIGKDMTGTMTNTLILAFAGGSFINLIIYAAYNMSYVQLMTSDFIVIELLQGISSTAAVVLTVPITSFTASCILLTDTELQNDNINNSNGGIKCENQ